MMSSLTSFFFAFIIPFYLCKFFLKVVFYRFLIYLVQFSCGLLLLGTPWPETSTDNSPPVDEVEFPEED